MGLKYKFKRANRIIDTFHPAELARAREIGEEIQNAEKRLSGKGEKLFLECKTQCQGLCCRNIRPDEIISLYDLLFILVMNPELNGPIAECVEKETLFFASNCIFLKDGQGPCIFPSDSMPEICITAFCHYEKLIEKEINYLKRKFIKLTWFICLRKPWSLKNKARNYLTTV